MWTAKERQLLDAILDELIPPRQDGSIPGAGALGVADFLPSAHAYASDPVGAVKSVLAIVEAKIDGFSDLPPANRVAILKSVEAEEPEAFATLTRLTYMGYYSRADIRPHFGVGAHPVHPMGYPVEQESADLMDALTEPVRKRGKAYRDAPETGAAT